ncbi:hypothetical protein [Lignipirellula cremea]|uniref:PilZ domain-containing protein n=1 Tax=Lignipirellula cremea TaxID=2528010 RepID=A0A518DMI1_9BACT|nr:hypothetical protein [Lignipirellula cremea]QDU93021.1 hypothetical protein Pla8534_07960 [Lignipirellula cremea]
MTNPRLDNEFFDMIHSLLQEEQQLGIPENRRVEVRRHYNRVTLLAPYDGENLPQAADFAPRLCHDLSSQGFSFVSTERPETSLVVVALGVAPFKFFAAEIRNVRQLIRDSQVYHYIGCQIRNRLRP